MYFSSWKESRNFVEDEKKGKGNHIPGKVHVYITKDGLWEGSGYTSTGKGEKDYTELKGLLIYMGKSKENTKNFVLRNEMGNFHLIYRHGHLELLNHYPPRNSFFLKETV